MSGWRAAVVALAVGAVILAVGWVVGRRPAAADSPTTTVPETGVTLVCAQALDLVCDGLAARLGASHREWTEGEAPADDQVVLAATPDLPQQGTPFARSPIAIAVWRERAGVLAAACGGSIEVACLIELAGTPWKEIGGQVGWGEVKLGLADPEDGIADQEAWRLFSGQALPESFPAAVRTRSESDGELMAELIQFGPSRADAVVTGEVAIASQLENAKNRGIGRLDVFYPSAGPWVEYGALPGEGRAARELVEQLAGDDIQALLGSLGLRPLAGEVVGLMEDLGQPGDGLPSLTPAEIGPLVAQWQEVMG